MGGTKAPACLFGVDAQWRTELRRSCGALPWTTTVSLSLPKSNSPIRKEERLAIKLRTERCPKNALWTSELRKSFKEGVGSTRNAERKGRTPTLDPLC